MEDWQRSTEQRMQCVSSEQQIGNKRAQYSSTEWMCVSFPAAKFPAGHRSFKLLTASGLLDCAAKAVSKKHFVALNTQENWGNRGYRESVKMYYDVCFFLLRFINTQNYLSPNIMERSIYSRISGHQFSKLCQHCSWFKRFRYLNWLILTTLL